MNQKRILTITKEQLKDNIITLLERNNYQMSVEFAEEALNQPKVHIKAALEELCTKDMSGKVYTAKDSLFSKR